jgi:alkane 1-monooxygenase
LLNNAMQFRALKYLMSLTGPALAFWALSQQGYWSFAMILYGFGLVPLIELLLPPDPRTVSKQQEAVAKQDRLYDYLLYAIVPVQYGLLGYFLWVVTFQPLATYEVVGLTLGMGTACGMLGINVAHELGHRRTAFEQTLAKALLLTSQYMHFFIEHNKGHHRWVATEEDPASARYGESLYAFWLRSVVNSYRSAWQIEAKRLSKAGLPTWHPRNEMLQFAAWQLGLLAIVGLVFGGVALGLYAAAAVMGFLLLETVNYIEHYGLRRRKQGTTHYEATLPIHSWNSDHVMGRLMLFELTRHSDHHYRPNRKYQVLRHFDEAPQMPTGYPGMMLLALVPPLWFAVMHRQIARLRAEHPSGEALAA